MTHLKTTKARKGYIKRKVDKLDAKETYHVYRAIEKCSKKKGK